uniref:stage III sporulation protein AA n=1 Tax=Agathobacter sp. TaxID=2021311 RepID=UPI0040566089
MQHSLISIFPFSMRLAMHRISWEGLEEIRIRIGWPVELVYGDRTEWLKDKYARTDRHALNEMLNYMTGYSLYSVEEELRQGYLTVEGGHRVGLTGHTAYASTVGGYEVQHMSDIGGLNIRIAHEVRGCADGILPYIRKEHSLYNTILFSPPGIGKTTYLRDCIRQLSSGGNGFMGMKIGVVDERSEIAACYQGKSQNDLGNRTDILDSCPKEVGMKMLLRSMSPQVIAVDELGKEKEFELIEEMRCCGVKLLGTMHAGSMEEILSNPKLKRCLENRAIERFIELIRLPGGERAFRAYDESGMVKAVSKEEGNYY